MSYCTKCGAQNADGVSFCTNCGEPMNTARPQPQPQPQPQQQPVYYTQPQPQPQPQPVYYAEPAAPAKKPVSKGRKIASLILGIHSLLYALAAIGTCWIPAYAIGLAFIGLITGIIACALYKRGLAVAGIVISAIMIVVSIVILIIQIVVGTGTAIIGNTDVSSMLEDLLNNLK